MAETRTAAETSEELSSYLRDYERGERRLNHLKDEVERLTAAQADRRARVVRLEDELVRAVEREAREMVAKESDEDIAEQVGV